MPAMTTRTHTDPHALLSELNEVREQGWAMDGAVNLVGAQRDRGVQGLDGRVSVIWVRLRQSVR
jgi:hypothetical protein